MLDLFTILTKGGLVLWRNTPDHLTGSPIDALIKNVLIEERSGARTYSKDNYAMKWTFSNENDLVFIAVYQKILHLTYIDELLETAKRIFIDRFYRVQGGQSQMAQDDFSDFEPIFSKALVTIEDKYATQRGKALRAFEAGREERTETSGTKKSAAQPEVVSAPEDEIAKNIQALKLQPSPRKGPGSRSSKGRGSAKSSATSSPNPNEDSKKKKSQKQARVWDGQVTKGAMEALDYSNKDDKADDQDASSSVSQLVDEEKLGSVNATGVYEVQDMTTGVDDHEELDFGDDDASGPQEERKGLFSYLKSFTNQREVTADMLVPVLATMKEHLIQKNVASEIAEHLCQSIKTSLVGKKLGSFERLSTVTRQSMESALTRILTPNTSLDILRDIEYTRKQRPYVISFIGVNGVGKSTNLSKVCFWLLQNNYKILIAACDTFRSGAVEQLRVHARNLETLQTRGHGTVKLFERGYGKDSAGIAKEAIKEAAANRYDVVLIDTAGRMQDNEPLMRALSKLVAVNQPDKVIFVGEALVGNEAVDQLTKFNQALKDFSGSENPRQIDGMILTKFDTIDDKVGAALSMTYITGKPIYFVGTGQTYTDLKSLKVSHVVDCLLRK